MRKEKYITIDAKNRDEGKMFHIHEMPAYHAEKWALQALFLLGEAGISIPDSVKDMGMGALALEGLKALSRVPFEKSEPLLDELLSCVKIVPDPGNKDIKRSDIKNDIEEITTYLKLRAEVFKLHTDFFTSAGD